MNLISDDYRRQNAQLHKDRPTYGAGGHKWLDPVLELVVSYRCATMLDYGCGKCTLEHALAGHFEGELTIHNYDPALPELAQPPEAAHLVVCTDVLEHIEPQNLHAVLAHIQSLAQKCAFLVIATRPAKKTLPDGRNAHLIVQSPEWWIGKLRQYFDICKESWHYDAEKDELVVEARPLT